MLSVDQDILTYMTNTIPVDLDPIAARLNLTVMETVLDDDTYGVLVIKNHQGVIGLQQFHHFHKQRYTLAHLIGHYLLHAEKPNGYFVETGFSLWRKEDSHQQEANDFAMRLLMPSLAIVNCLDALRVPVDIFDESFIQRMANKFKVMPQAMTIRLLQFQEMQI